MFYCPKCATQAVQGQNFCRNCGTDLSVIFLAIDGKQRGGPIDFETLKKDLFELGSHLHARIKEEATAFKSKTQKLNERPAAPKVVQPIPIQLPNWSREFNKALRKVKLANSRKYSLQQAALSIFGGGAMLVVWKVVLEQSAQLIQSLEAIVTRETGLPLEGFEPLLQNLWLFALIPIAKGIAHLINGICFAPKQIDETQDEQVATPQQFYYSPVTPAPSAVPPSAVPVDTAPVHTAQFEQPNFPSYRPYPSVSPSVTEDETVRFEHR